MNDDENVTAGNRLKLWTSRHLERFNFKEPYPLDSFIQRPSAVVVPCDVIRARCTAVVWLSTTTKSAKINCLGGSELKSINVLSSCNERSEDMDTANKTNKSRELTTSDVKFDVFRLLFSSDRVHVRPTTSTVLLILS
jgi:hypothetical protein